MRKRFSLALLGGLSALSSAALAFVACSSFSEEADPQASGDGGSSDAPVVDGEALDASVDARARADASSAYRAAVFADSPIAYWRMGATNGGSVRNEVPGATSLVLQTPGAFTVGVPGALVSDPDTAIAFNGQAGHAVANDPGKFVFPTARPFTIELWARSDAPDSGGEAFPTLFSAADGFDTTTNGYLLYIVAANDRAQFNYGPAVMTSLAPVGRGWRHFAATFDGKTATLFVDGAVNASTTPDGGSSTRPMRFAVGANLPFGRYFTGSIDEVAVYDKALTVEQIAAHLAAR